jgi:hypothetical protein
MPESHEARIPAIRQVGAASVAFFPRKKGKPGGGTCGDADNVWKKQVFLDKGIQDPGGEHDAHGAALEYKSGIDLHDLASILHYLQAVYYYYSPKIDLFSF